MDNITAFFWGAALLIIVLIIRALLKDPDQEYTLRDKVNSYYTPEKRVDLSSVKVKSKWSVKPTREIDNIKLPPPRDIPEWKGDE